MIPGKKYTPEDLLAILWRRRWLLVTPLVVIGFVSAGYALHLPNVYRSDTTILVVPQRVPESYVRSTVTARIEDRLQSISQQILSRTRLERIIEDFNLYPELRRKAFMEEVVAYMRRNITVQLVKGDAFRVSYVSYDPRSAMQVTQQLASLFIGENLKDREVLADATNEFLETQLHEARTRLIQHERKLEAYYRQHPGELPNQLNANLQAMSGAQMQLQAVVDALNRDRDRQRVLDGMAADLAAETSSPSVTIPTSLPNTTQATVEQPDAPGLRNEEQLYAARKLLRELELRLKPAHPDVVRVKRAIAELEEKVAADAAEAARLQAERLDSLAEPKIELVSNTDDISRRRRAVRDEQESLVRQIAAKEAEHARLTSVITAYERRVDAVPTRESELIELTRDYSTLQA